MTTAFLPTTEARDVVEPEAPRLAITYQLLSTIPQGHDLLACVDTYGEWSPAEDLVFVPEWLHTRIMAWAQDRDQPPRTVTEAQTGTIIPAGFADTLRAAPLRHDPDRELLTNALATRYVPAPPEWCLGLSPNIVLPQLERIREMTYHELIELVTEQFEDIRTQLDDSQSEVMQWARNVWEEQHAVRTATEAGDTEQEDQPAEAGNGADAQPRRIELYANYHTFGIRGNQGAVIRNVE